MPAERWLSELGGEYRDKPPLVSDELLSKLGTTGGRKGGKPEIVINQMILVGFSCHDAA